MELSIFEKNKLTLPPELWEDVEQPEDDQVNQEEIAVVSDDDDGEDYSDDDDDMETDDDDSGSDEDVDDIEDWAVPVVFVVDRHFVSIICLSNLL